MPVCRYPIVGDADRTISPSSSSTSRNTPCVLGCCGPMLTVIVSVRSSGIVVKKHHHGGHGGHGGSNLRVENPFPPVLRVLHGEPLFSRQPISFHVRPELFLA